MLATAHGLMHPAEAPAVAMVTTGDSLASFMGCVYCQAHVAPPPQEVEPGSSRRKRGREDEEEDEQRAKRGRGPAAIL